MEFTGNSGTGHRKPRRTKGSVRNDRFLFLINQPLNQVDWIFRVGLLILFTIFTVRFVASPMDYEKVSGFWHLVNLPFHEAGHIIFGFLPPILVSFMGTGMQLLMPMVCGFTLMFKTLDSFGAVICLWWFGENFLDIAPYIADARAGELPLLGGNTGQDSPYGFHDWEFILGELNLQMHDIAIGTFAWNSGKMIMIGAVIWGGLILYRSYQMSEWKRASSS